MIINKNFLSNAQCYTSIGLLGVFIKVGEFGGPNFDIVSKVLMISGIIGTTIFITKKAFTKDKI